MLNRSQQKSGQSKALENYTVANGKYQLLSGESLRTIALISCGLASTLIYLKILQLGDLRMQVPEYVYCVFILSMLYLLASYFCTQKASVSDLWTVLAFAAAFRLITFLSTPTLSDDIYRYAWEGYLQTQGINPYVSAPDATELIRYRNEIWKLVNNKTVAAIYPPASQIFNALTYSLFHSIWGFKTLVLVVDGVVIWGILRLLALRAQNLNYVVFYAWSPLVVTEVAGNGHNDVLAVAFMIWSTIYCLTNCPIRSVILLGASILSKLYPIALVPSFFKRTALRNWLWLPLVLALGYAPYIRAGGHLFDALSYYKEKWRFNGFLFAILTQSFSSETAAERFNVIFTLLLIVLCLAGVTDLLKQHFWLLSGLLLLTPTLFPWYLVWIMPLLCFFPSTAWMVLSVTSAISYYVLIDWWTLGIWRQNDFFMRLQYYPFFALLLFDWSRSLFSRRANACCQSAPPGTKP
jgi:alpha-1,6-mannosyltransferase